MVGNLTGTQIPTLNLTNTSTFSGQSQYNNYTYQTEVKYVSGLLKNSSGEFDIMPAEIAQLTWQTISTTISRRLQLVKRRQAMTDSFSVEDNGLPAIDGLVAVLTVKIMDRPAR